MVADVAGASKEAEIGVDAVGAREVKACAEFALLQLEQCRTSSSL